MLDTHATIAQCSFLEQLQLYHCILCYSGHHHHPNTNNTERMNNDGAAPVHLIHYLQCLSVEGTQIVKEELLTLLLRQNFHNIATQGNYKLLCCNNTKKNGFGDFFTFLCRDKIGYGLFGTFSSCWTLNANRLVAAAAAFFVQFST